MGWLIDYIDEIGEGIDIVQRDLKTVELLRSTDFANIRIIMIDLEAIKENMSVIDNIKIRISSHKQPYYVSQVYNKPDTMHNKSCISSFRGLPVIPSYPEIITDQNTFQVWLDNFSQKYLTAVKTISQYTFEISDNEMIMKSLNQIANEVRDTSIIKNLSEDDIITLTNQAVEQELGLGRIAKEVGVYFEGPVILDSIRDPLVNIVLKPKTKRLEPIALTAMRLNQPKHKLTVHQRRLADSFGLKFGKVSIIRRDQPNIGDLMESLGNVVESAKITTKLPLGFKEKYLGNISKIKGVKGPGI